MLKRANNRPGVSATEASAKKREPETVQLEMQDALLPEQAALAAALVDWFKASMRPLPWRRSYDPYEVWISEVMLQQTQMDRAADYFQRWMGRFPTLRSVAEADPEDTLKAWEGLGYYSRVKNLQKAAQVIMREHGGRVPDNFSALRALPGVGPYTAGAVLSIAYNQPVAAVDANVERVFARIFDVGAPVKSIVSANFIRHMAERLIPPGQARLFNQALMELGALICGKKPRCEDCPIASWCQARRLGIAHERPIPGKRMNYSALEILSGVLVYNGRIFIQKRLESGVWAGLWEFPGGRLEPGETPEQGIVREFMEETEFSLRVKEKLGLVRHAYTRYRIAMHCFVCEFACDPLPADSHAFPRPVLHAATQYRWALPEELDDVTLPAGHRKLADTWLPRIREFVKDSCPEDRQPDVGRS